MSATLITPTAPALLTPEQAARILTVSKQTLANWRLVGRGPRYVHVGRLVRYRVSELESWLAANSRN